MGEYRERPSFELAKLESAGRVIELWGGKGKKGKWEALNALLGEWGLDREVNGKPHNHPLLDDAKRLKRDGMLGHPTPALLALVEAMVDEFRGTKP